MAMRKTFVAVAILLGSMAIPAFGQADPNQPAPGADRPRFDPAQFRQRMLDRLKEELGTNDEEFKALQPKIEKVFQSQRDLNAGRFGGRRGGRGPGGDAATPGGTQPQSAVQTASTDLQKTLENKDAKPDEIKTKLDALREAKTKAKSDLAAAQQDLRGVLSQRQEAVLVMSGLLD